MIQIQYKVPVTGGSKLPVQTQQVENVVLDNGELLMLGLTIVPGSDMTSVAGLVITRQIQFNETADFIARVGLPFTDVKRKAFVQHLFDYKLTQRLRKTVGEQISLF